MNIEEKRKRIKEICKEQMQYLKKIRTISKLPKGKRPSTGIKRIFRTVHYVMIIKSLEMQKHIIASQLTTPKFEKGGNIAKEKEVAIYGTGEEVIINKSGKKIGIIPNK